MKKNKLKANYFEAAMMEISRKGVLHQFAKVMGIIATTLTVLLIILSLSMRLHNAGPILFMLMQSFLLSLQIGGWAAGLVWLYFVIKPSIENRFSAGEAFCKQLKILGLITGGAFVAVTLLVIFIYPPVAFFIGSIVSMITFSILVFMEGSRILLPYFSELIKRRCEIREQL